MQANFTKPYNIEVLYKWLDIESDMAATLVPPTEDNAAGLADVLKKIWCLPYVNIAGSDFFCKLAPKQLMFIGSSVIIRMEPSRKGRLKEDGRSLFMK